MEGFAENVVLFNEEILKVPRGEKELESIVQSKWLIHALMEEVREYEDAHRNDNYIGAIDALIDLMYFAIGGLHRMGLTPCEMAWCGEIVHKTNMRKKLGIVERRGDGTVADAIKPREYESPEEMLAYFLGVKS